MTLVCIAMSVARTVCIVIVEVQRESTKRMYTYVKRESAAKQLEKSGRHPLLPKLGRTFQKRHADGAVRSRLPASWDGLRP